MACAIDKTGFDAFMSYNTELSARKTQVVLGVFSEQDQSGGKRQTLKVIDLKQASITDRIRYWWNGNLEKKTIGNYLSLHMDDWSKEKIGDNKELQLQFEKQCAKLSRKITFVHKYQWPLNVTFQCPNAKNPNKQIEKTEVYTFDRLTTNKDFLDFTDKQEYSFKTKKEHRLYVSLRFGDAFAHKAYTGDFSGKDNGYFLQDSEHGKERSCTITLSEPRQRYIAERAAKTYNEEIINTALMVTVVATVALPVTLGVSSIYYIAAIALALEGGGGGRHYG